MQILFTFLDHYLEVMIAVLTAVAMEIKVDVLNLDLKL